LRDLDDAPALIFVRGAMLPPVSRAVAIVGSRAASPYGRAMAGRLAGDLARLGMVVVSGLARGIDGAAHRAALEAGGATVAVLPGGLDAVTPRHHAELAETIAARGTLMTERETGGPGHPAAFVTRNRLIAALGAATVVVEAAARSGALSTARAARRLRRPVLAVPGDVDRETARGCHRLLREGAALCEDAADVLRAVQDSPGGRAAVVGSTDVPATARLGAALRREARTVEALAREAGMTVPEALAALLALQWAGTARSHPGQRWARGSR
jgi:DNA processing protein